MLQLARRSSYRCFPVNRRCGGGGRRRSSREGLKCFAIDPLKSVSWALVQEGVSNDINTVRDIPLPDYDQDVDPALFADSGGYPVTCLVNVLYPWTTMAAVGRLIHHAIILEFDGESMRVSRSKGGS
jgi:hypothetical protein